MYSLINLSGLTVGLACSLLIFLYVQDELSFDTIHEDYEQIRRLDSKYVINESFIANLHFPAGVAPYLQEEVAGIKNSTRYETKDKSVVSSGQDKIYETGLAYTDPSFFKVFNFSLEKGNEETALSNPYSIVVSTEIAQKYFPGREVIGKTLTIDQKEYTITGQLAPMPHNTHLSFTMLASFKTLEKPETLWSPFPNYKTYVELEKTTSVEDLHASVLEVIQTNAGESGAKYQEISSIPVGDIYLKKDNYVHKELRGNMEYVRMFLAIGLLVLAIACINYMNLATARASLRSMEIGIRKVSGALRTQLVQQFLSESILLTLFSALLAIGVIEFMLPGFNAITGKTLTLSIMQNPMIIVGIILVALVTGFLAGGYPALFLSRFKPVSVLKGQFKTGKSATFLRKGLVVVQFVITIGLIVSTLIINNQLNYLQERGLGIEAETLVSIPAKNDIPKQYQSFKSELLKNPDVKSVTNGSLLLGGISFNSYNENDGIELKPKSEILQVYSTDHDFLPTLGLKTLAGRGFDIEKDVEGTRNILLNETSIDEFGWAEPSDAIGKEIIVNEKPHTVIGIVQDFHSVSPTNRILPTAIYIGNDASYQVLIRLDTPHLASTLESLKETWSSFEPFIPFEINFMDDELNAYYIGERNLKILFSAFAFLTIFIACLGLLGLATFTAEQRKKEIGIRKVLGASVEKIVTLVFKDFVYLVGFGFLIAAPTSWYFMNEWIQDYPYRIDIDYKVFVIGGLVALAISMLTVSYQSIKAAISNPIDSLRSE